MIIGLLFLLLIVAPPARRTFAEGRGLPPGLIQRVLELGEVAPLVTDQRVRLETVGALTQITVVESRESFGVAAPLDEVVSALCLDETLRRLRCEVILCYAR